LEKSRLFFEHLAAEWDARQPPDRQHKLDQLLFHFDAQIKPAKIILEVGTGTGGLLPVLKQHNSLARIIQIDFANAMLVRAQVNRNGDELVQADVHQLPFAAITFDLVICLNSFPHFKQKLLALQTIHSVMPTGGHLLILHELSREKVNAIHQNARAAEIHQDLLLENDEMHRIFFESGFLEIKIDDGPDRYSVVARKQTH
jgi:ubiquinone/menaquinone biosynthesis C-methylase UbiE